MWNTPNLLTLLRIFLIPVFVAIFYLPLSWARLACAMVFGAAALTDWLDGYLARRWQQTSPLGAFLDPVADKLMVAVALVLLVQADPPSLPSARSGSRQSLVARVTVSALREWSGGASGPRSRVGPFRWSGNSKTIGADGGHLSCSGAAGSSAGYPGLRDRDGPALYRRGADLVVDDAVPASGLAKSHRPSVVRSERR